MGLWSKNAFEYAPDGLDGLFLHSDLGQVLGLGEQRVPQLALALVLLGIRDFGFLMQRKKQISEIEFYFSLPLEFL